MTGVIVVVELLRLAMIRALSIAGIRRQTHPAGGLIPAPSFVCHAPALKQARSRNGRILMIDLYTWSTPNGRKISIMLEDLGLPYRTNPIDISTGEQFAAIYLAINPNGK